MIVILADTYFLFSFHLFCFSYSHTFICRPLQQVTRGHCHQLPAGLLFLISIQTLFGLRISFFFKLLTIPGKQPISDKITNLGKLEKLLKYQVVILYSRMEEIWDSESSSLSPFTWALRFPNYWFHSCFWTLFIFCPLTFVHLTLLILERLHSIM